jgi:DUF4097 and DUF4098 domain-containing protein YvlB
MTRDRLASYLIPLLALALGSGCALSSAEEVKEQTVTVKPGTSVHVETRNGRIKVVEGPDGKVRIKSIKKARSTTSPRKLLAQIKVVVKQKSGTLYVTAEHPSGRFTRQFGVNFELTVPKATRLNLETRNGSVRLGHMNGPVAVNTRNGSIKAQHVAGSLTAITKNGSIRIGGVGSTFEVRTYNGSIRVRLAVTVKLTTRCVAETRNGSIRINAPKSLAANVTAETRNGSIHSDFGLAISSRKHAAGKVGGGGPPIELKTRNGSIHLESR